MKTNTQNGVFGMAVPCVQTKKIGSESEPLEFVSVTRWKWEQMKAELAAKALENNKLLNAKTAEEKLASKTKTRRNKKKTQGEIDREIVETFYKNPTSDAFATIWNRFHYGVHSYAFRFINDWERAGDVVQDTFQKAWEKRDTYNPEKSVYSTWLYTIARNLALTQLQATARDKTIDVDINDVFHSSLNTVADTLSSNDDTYYTVDSVGNITESNYEDITRKIYDTSLGELNKMDPTFVKIMDMKNVQDLTLREIASRLGMTESKVKNIYYKNKEILRDNLLAKHSDLYETYLEASHDKTEREVFFA